MEGNVPLVWVIAISIAFGLMLGYAIGMAIGVSTGKRQLLNKIKMLLFRERIDFDIDALIRSRHSKFIREDFL